MILGTMTTTRCTQVGGLILWWFTLIHKNPWYTGGESDNKEEYLKWKNLFPMVLGYKRGSSSTEEVRVYMKQMDRKEEEE